MNEGRYSDDMANKYRGRFYLKRTINGNLFGEFSIRTDGQIYSESCDVLQRDSEKLRQDCGSECPYVGRYLSTWQEEGRVAVFADLTIQPKPGRKNVFTVVWEDRGEGTRGNADGEGMLCDDMLIGDYQVL
jgi:hypothetical protein